MRINWENVIKVAEQELRAYYEKNKDSMSLRGLFYVLVSKNVIPNTLNAYKKLSEVLAEVRYAGDLPAYLIKDVSRKSVDCEREEQFNDKPLSVEELKELLRKYIEGHTNVSINPWVDQPYRVIIAFEKEALYDTIYNIVSKFPHGVYRISCLKGFDSATDIIRIARTVEGLNKRGYKVAILILSDFDPSGEEIARDFETRLKRLNNKFDGQIEKITITRDQIFQYNLPYAPTSEEEKEKLRRDPRYKGFVDKYGLMRVELDALVSIYPQEFEKILISAIEKYFDKSIYETKTLKRLEELKAKSEDVKKVSYENLKKLLGEG